MASLRTTAGAAIILATLLLAACAGTPERPATYKVRRGDTLYSIAWRHRLNYEDLARWNGIDRRFVIHPGQVLRLYPPTVKLAKPVDAAAARTSRPALPRTQPHVRAATKTVPRAQGPAVQWHWPVKGGTATLTSRPNGGHGLTIAGQRGEAIHAAGTGRVVYTGSGLLGYGQLVIIKHNETYLSAYGHTQAVAVREGDSVRAGQRIATMGAGPQGMPMLYFEIRINGVPSNPLALLPRRR